MFSFFISLGLLCSVLGIGGGELFGPFLLSMRVIPQVSSSTTSLMSCVTSMYNIVDHIMTGNMPYVDGVILFLVGKYIYILYKSLSFRCCCWGNWEIQCFTFGKETGPAFFASIYSLSDIIPIILG